MSDLNLNSTSAATNGHKPHRCSDVGGGALPQPAEEQPFPVDSVADPVHSSHLKPPVSPPPPPPSGVPPEGCASDHFAKEGEVRVRPSKMKIFDPIQELDASLPAKTKVLLLKGGLEGRGMKATRDELQAAEKFFAANPAWTARHLIDLMARCQALGPTTGKFEHLWLCKKGARLSYLVPNLQQILGKMKLEDQYPKVSRVEG